MLFVLGKIAAGEALVNTKNEKLWRQLVYIRFV